MSQINNIISFVQRYARQQQRINTLALLVFTLSTILICTMVSLLLLKSPLYGVLGLVPLLFLRRTSLIEHARALEQQHGLNGELVNSIQLASLIPDSREHYSQDLIQAYIDRAVRICDARIPGFTIDRLSLHKALRILSIVLIFSLLYPAIAPARFWFALHRRIEYQVQPIAHTCIRGENVQISLQLFGVYLPQNVQFVQSTFDDHTSTRIPVTENYAHMSVTADQDFSYAFRFYNHTTPHQTVTVIDPLSIQTLAFDLQYPEYTKLPDETKTGRQIIAPQGTHVTVRGTVSDSISAAYIIGKDTVTLESSGNRFSGIFTIQSSETAILHVQGHMALDEEIVIYAIPDISPHIAIFYPGYNVMIPQTMELTVGIQCSDDYGLHRVRFVHAFKETISTNLAVQRNALEDTLLFTWDLSTLHILPGDEVVYYAEVTDNAGHTNRSRAYTVYFPTMEEIYENITETEEYLTEDLKEAQTEHNEDIKALARIQETLMKERTLSWADQEKLKDVLAKEEELLEKINDWQSELEKTIEQLEQGMVLDQQSIERLQEISRIMQEIAPDELKQALEQFQRVAEQDPQKLQEQIDRLKQHKEELAKALERTLEILRRFQQELALQELAKMAEDLAQQAQTIDSLSQSMRLTEQEPTVEDFTSDLETFADKLEELAQSEGLEQELAEALKELSKQIRSMMPQIPFNADQHAQSLKNMSAELQQWYERITQGRTALLRKKLIEILNQLIEISKSQEEFAVSGQPMNIEQQHQILTATRAIAESLYAQESKSMYITKHLTKNMAKTLATMERSIHAEPQLQGQFANESMRLVNLVALELLNNLEQMSQGQGSSTGLDKFLEQLANISQGQMMLNQSMFNLFPLPQPGLSPEQQAQLSELAAKQQALREALQGLQQEYSGIEYGSMLDKIAEDMQETEQALYQHKIDRQLIERQQKLLTRLLDAQKSIRSSDYGKKRKSTPGSDVVKREYPGPLPSDLGKDELQLLLQRALREPLPEEYELYIRAYFKRLVEEP